MNSDWVFALIGGALIGISVSLMLFWNGRVTGISGIVNGLLSFKNKDHVWRLLFVFGLILGGLTMRLIKPDVFSGSLQNENLITTIAAGLLVGFGTIMGSGCTSGHGVCGISRMSIRSVLATVVFITAGVLSVLIFKKMGLI